MRGWGTAHGPAGQEHRPGRRRPERARQGFSGFSTFQRPAGRKIFAPLRWASTGVGEPADVRASSRRVVDNWGNPLFPPLCGERRTAPFSATRGTSAGFPIRPRREGGGDPGVGAQRRGERGSSRRKLRRRSPAFPVGCLRNERWSEIPSPFRGISRVCEEENFPPCDVIRNFHCLQQAMTPMGVIRRFTGLAPLRLAAAGLTSGSPAGARIQSSRAFAASLRGWPPAPRPREDFGRRGREPTRRWSALYHILGVGCFRGHTISGCGFNLFKPLRANPRGDARLEPRGDFLGRF
jgi:hypothetical protein